jgi:hypothetical protein
VQGVHLTLDGTVNRTNGAACTHVDGADGVVKNELGSFKHWESSSERDSK